MALTPRVELPGVRSPVVHELVASLALFRILRVWTSRRTNLEDESNEFENELVKSGKFEASRWLVDCKSGTDDVQF